MCRSRTITWGFSSAHDEQEIVGIRFRLKEEEEEVLMVVQEENVDDEVVMMMRMVQGEGIER